MDEPAGRARSALKQRLECLGRAGVTHLPKVAAAVERAVAAGRVAAAPRGAPTLATNGVPNGAPLVAPEAEVVNPPEPPRAAPPLGTTGGDFSAGTARQRGPVGPEGQPHAAVPSAPALPQSPTLWDTIQAASPRAAPADPSRRREALAAVARRVAACRRCGELVRNRTQTVFGVGNPCARLVFLGEAPGADEDRLGEPFVGRAGQLLTDIIVKGMKLRREDVYILNILKCRPPDNRTPEPVEAAACREYLDAQLAIIQPEFICCLGAVAAQCLMGVKSPVGRLRGRVIEWEDYRVVCTWHPAYLLRNPAAKQQTWDDIKLLMAAMGLSPEGKPRG